MKVLIVDDSLLCRRMLQDIVSRMEFVDGIETAASGQEAIAKARSWRPDVITLDVDMPDISGIRVLRELNEGGGSAEVVMVSGLTRAGTGIADIASELGAVDFVSKPVGSEGRIAVAQLEKQLGLVLRAIASKRHPTAPAGRSPAARPMRPLSSPARRPDIVAIGASTGGPVVLGDMVGSLPRDLRVPVLIALHLTSGFTRTFVEALQRRATIRVVEAQDGHPLEPATVYLAPGGRHLSLTNRPEVGIRLCVTDDDPEDGCRPSVNRLFRSVADVFGDRALAVILTGMGDDGVAGLKRIKERGGFVLAQDEESCVVFGMPDAAIKAGVVDIVGSPHELSARIITFVQRPK